MLHPGFIKPERIANVCSEIQIVDTHKSLEARFVIEFAACMTQFNRTLLISNMEKILHNLVVAHPMSLDVGARVAGGKLPKTLAAYFEGLEDEGVLVKIPTGLSSSHLVTALHPA
jgi:hypothetical protein